MFRKVREGMGLHIIGGFVFLACRAIHANVTFWSEKRSERSPIKAFDCADRYTTECVVLCSATSLSVSAKYASDAAR